VPSSARPTRLLVFVFAIVFHRWLEIRTGWPDAVLLPAAAFVALLAFDLLATPRADRLTRADWLANAVVAGVLAAIVWVAAP
jgi:hypothetical protein